MILRCRSQAPHECDDLFRIPTSRSKMAHHDHPFPVQDEGGGDRSALEAFGRLGSEHIDRQIDSPFFHELPHQFDRFPGDAGEVDVEVGGLVPQPLKVGHLGDAGGAPGRPEVEDQRFPRQLREVYGCSGKVRGVHDVIPRPGWEARRAELATQAPLQYPRPDDQGPDDQDECGEESDDHPMCELPWDDDPGDQNEYEQGQRDTRKASCDSPRHSSLSLQPPPHALVAEVHRFTEHQRTPTDDAV